MTLWTPPSIIAYCEPGLTEGDIFATLGLRVSENLPQNAWVLTLRALPETGTILELIRPDGVKLNIDFSSGKARHRARESGKGIQPLARALSVGAYRKQYGQYPHIIDATGGWGQDAWALASLGVSMTVIEQHPLVHALLANALLRAAQQPETQATASRVTLLHGNAENLLGPEIAKSQQGTHAIYLDPMYPERSRKKAESRKGMQFLHALLGPPDSRCNANLLPAALLCPVQRVVVKRPRGAERLGTGQPWSGQLTSIESPNTRFDVYHRL